MAVGLGRVALVAPWVIRAALTRRRPQAKGKRVLMLTVSDVHHDPRVRKTSQTLAAHGYEVDVAAPTHLESREEVVAPNVRYIHVERRWLWRFFLVYQDEFRRLGLGREFDYVHANDLTTLTVAWMLARLRRRPLVYDAHELWTENLEPSGDSWKPMSSRTRRLAQLWERYLLRSVDKTITVSPSIVEELARRTRNGDRPLLLPNYPSTALLQVPTPERSLREECGLSEDHFVTLYLGGVNPFRNIENVIRAHRHLPEEYVFVVRGPGIEALGSDYRRLAKAEGVSKRLYLLPPVGMDEVVAAAHGADCGIVMLRNLCKNFFYFFPNKLFEYALAGLPVAVSDFPDVRGFVGAERCGVTFDPDSPVSIARALQSLGDNRAEARAMGARGRKSIVERRNWEIAATELVTAYERLPRAA